MSSFNLKTDEAKADPKLPQKMHMYPEPTNLFCRLQFFGHLPSLPLRTQLLLLFVHSHYVWDQEYWKAGWKSQIDTPPPPTISLTKNPQSHDISGQCCRPKNLILLCCWFNISEMSVLILLFSGSYNNSGSQTLSHTQNLSSFSITFSSPVKAIASTAQVWLNTASARFS